ncbi:MAG: response regulator transcription factor NblR [Chroococcales cyanobacterium]
MSAIVPEKNSCVLFVQTDEAFAQRASIDLREAGYATVLYPDVQSCLTQLDEFEPAMILIDRALAGDAATKFCRQLRKMGNRVPLLMIMSSDTVEDRVACLEAGADDYLLKPYSTDAFLQMVRLYLEPIIGATEQLRFGELVLDLGTRRVIRNGRVIDLTMKEFELLKYLMSYPREVLTREQILENVWGYDFMGESNVIEVYIRYLRLKIEDEGEKRLIQTVRGVGYVLRES